MDSRGRDSWRAAQGHAFSHARNVTASYLPGARSDKHGGGSMVLCAIDLAERSFSIGGETTALEAAKVMDAGRRGV